MKTLTKIALVASLALIIVLAAFAAFNILNILAGPSSLSEPELADIARAWTADSMDGAAGDELVEFIVANTTVNSPDLLRQYLKPRLDSGAAWTFGPFASAGADSYEAFATATLHINDVMPMTISYETEAPGESAPTAVVPGDFRNVFTMTFRLIVDAASKSVTEWRVQDGQAVFAPDILPPA